jgi:hypothetical protein
MFYLEHPDFSLIPDPDDPTQWRGVAKTRQGLLMLPSLWSRPQPDPDHPLCVFSWQPTPTAQSALVRHAPTACAVPLVSQEAHRTVWEAQRATAVLRTPTEAVCVPCCIEGREDVLRIAPCGQKSVLESRPEDTLYWALAEDPEALWNDPVHRPWTQNVWVPWAQEMWDHSEQQTLEMAPEAAERVRQHVLASGAVWQDSAFETTKTHQASLMWAFGLTDQQVHPFTALPFQEPQVAAGLCAFFEGRSPECLYAPEAQHAPFLRSLVAAIPLETQIASLRAAFQTKNIPTWLDSGVWSVAPRAAAQVCLEQVVLSKQRTPLKRGDLDEWVTEAMREGDTGFFDEVAKATVTPKKGPPLTFFSPEVRSCLEALTDRWKVFFRTADRTLGFSQRDTPEGLARFAHTFDEKTFAQPLRALGLSPPMMQALEDPAFLKALAPTGFGQALQRAPQRHPQWEAVLERLLLTTLWEGEPDVGVSRSKGLAPA